MCFIFWTQITSTYVIDTYCLIRTHLHFVCVVYSYIYDNLIYESNTIFVDAIYVVTGACNILSKWQYFAQSGHTGVTHKFCNTIYSLKIDFTILIPWPVPRYARCYNYTGALTRCAPCGVFLLNIFIDHQTVKSHLVMHVYNTNTIYELQSGRKWLDIFTFTVLVPCMYK